MKTAFNDEELSRFSIDILNAKSHLGSKFKRIGADELTLENTLRKCVGLSEEYKVSLSAVVSLYSVMVQENRNILYDRKKLSENVGA